MSRSADVLVIGGEPAGIAAAIAARQRGLEVTVADGCHPPIDKPCGEGLMPDGILALKKLGVEIPSMQAREFRGIRMLSAGLSVEAAFPSGVGVGVRRTNLHSIMVAHAESVGVKFLWGAVVTGLHDAGVMVQGKLVPSRWTIGADGSGSLVRRWAGLDRHHRRDLRFAFRRHYGVAPWSDFMELHWGRGCQLYVTPVRENEVCVALISGDSDLRLDEALGQFPEFAARLEGIEQGSVERGAISVSRRLARVCTGRVALIGDASGGVDAITGEGLCLAFNQAKLLAHCLAEGSLTGYHKGHRKISRRASIMARLMLVIAQHDGLRRRVMRVMMDEPRIFERMLATHVGAASSAEIAAQGLALGWKLATA